MRKGSGCPDTGSHSTRLYRTAIADFWLTFLLDLHYNNKNNNCANNKNIPSHESTIFFSLLGCSTSRRSHSAWNFSFRIFAENLLLLLLSSVTRATGKPPLSGPASLKLLAPVANLKHSPNELVDRDDKTQRKLPIVNGYIAIKSNV